MRNIRMGFRHTPFAYQLPGNLQGLTSKFLRSQSVQLLLPAIRAPMNDTGLKTRLEHREVRLVGEKLVYITKSYSTIVSQVSSSVTLKTPSTS